MAVNIKLGSKEKNLLGAVVVVFLFAFVGPQFLGDYAVIYRNAQGGIKQGFEKNIATIRQDLDSIEDRKEILRRYINRYQLLVEREVLALPNPVDLVKHMKAIATERRQNATKFEFGDNVIVPSASTAYTADSTINVNVSPLNVEMGMLHDMDMFMFMESLDSKLPNISFPVQCSMELVQIEFAVTNRENMRGVCQINWYAVTDPDQNVKTEDGAEITSAQS